eukprot:11140442-Prorocentrum_lima.AAC.1
MAGTHILDANRITGRLLQSYRALRILPEGVEHAQNRVVSPPCAGLQDLARCIRNNNAGNS